MTIEITQLALEILLVLIGLYLALFKSYFHEKGKNIATKEDVTEITRMIEKVKNQLYFSTHSKLNLKTEERNALVNFYEKYNHWLNLSASISFNGITEDTKYRLKDIEASLDDAKFQYDIATGRMQIFVKNEDINDIRNELVLKTINLHHLTVALSNEISLSLISAEKMKLSTPFEQQPDKYKEILNQRTIRFQEYMNEVVVMYSEISPLDRILRDNIHSHLQSLLTEEDGN